MSDDKKEFVFKIHYFKDNGKWYTDCDYKYECRYIGEGHLISPYMNDVVSHIRGLRDSDGQGAMPGLSDRTAGWDGYITVQWGNSYPTLILPSKQ